MATLAIEPAVRDNRPEWEDFAHTAPGTPAGRFMRRFWHPVYLARDLKIGRSVPVTIMNEDFTLYRGESGQPHALAFRCAHRGTQLSTGWVEGDTVRCFYHGWVYNAEGQCVEQPAEPEPFCQRIKIRSYPIEEYLGLIFVYFGEGDPPPMMRFPEFEGEGYLENSSYVRMCNYFNQLESNMDEAHVPFVHRSSAFTDTGLNRDVPLISGEETEYGVAKYGTRSDGIVRVSHFFMPDALMIAGSDGATDGSESWQVAWRVPVDDGHHRSFGVRLVPMKAEDAEKRRQDQEERRKRFADLTPATEVTAAILRGEMHVDDVSGRPDAVNIQDNVAQGGQGVIADRVHEHLGQSDVMIVMFRNIWSRELKAQAEGRPMKEWKKPTRVAATYGT